MDWSQCLLGINCPVLEVAGIVKRYFFGGAEPVFFAPGLILSKPIRSFLLLVNIVQADPIFLVPG